MPDWMPPWSDWPWWAKGGAGVAVGLVALIAWGWFNAQLARDDERPVQWQMNEVRKLLTIIGVLLFGILLAIARR